MRLVSPHCPNCGAAVKVEVGAARAECAYCGGVLVVEGERIWHRAPVRAAASEKEEKPPYPPPDSMLYAREAARFEMSVNEQKLGRAAASDQPAWDGSGLCLVGRRRDV